METPWYGSRQMARHLRRQGWCVGRKRVAADAQDRSVADLPGAKTSATASAAPHPPAEAPDDRAAVRFGAPT